MLKDARPAPGVGLRVVLYANEESTWFSTGSMGSNVHASALARAGNEVIAMLSLETIGYYSDAPGSQRDDGFVERLRQIHADDLGADVGG